MIKSIAIVGTDIVWQGFRSGNWLRTRKAFINQQTAHCKVKLVQRRHCLDIDWRKQSRDL
jgi:hypothetical protein